MQENGIHRHQQSLQFYIVDVFCERQYTGNQLAVFISDDPLSKEEMQSIAREINFSESTFVFPNEREAEQWRVRIFTPRQEVDFAGHPTLGTAYIIREKLITQRANHITMAMNVGAITVTCPEEKEDPLWMKQVEPQFGRTFDPVLLEAILQTDKGVIDINYPVQEVSTGLPHIIVPLKNLSALRKARVDKDKYFSFIENTWAKNILIFCNEGYQKEHHASMRMFADYLGIPEDPATGSGVGCLGAYLIKNKYRQEETFNWVIGQGYEIERPSRLYLNCASENNSIAIHVGGKVTEIAQGTWRVQS